MGSRIWPGKVASALLASMMPASALMAAQDVRNPSQFMMDDTGAPAGGDGAATQGEGLAETGSTAQIGTGRVGERQLAGQELIQPTGRLALRIGNRVENRIRNRIDRNYDPTANATAPFERAARPRP